jgi:hypothetical protein
MKPDEIEKLKHCFVYNSMENLRNLEVIKAMADIIRICAGDGVELYCLRSLHEHISFSTPARTFVEILIENINKQKESEPC